MQGTPPCRRRGISGRSTARAFTRRLQGRRMSDPQHDALLMLALGVLSEPPCSVDVLSEDGGSFPMQLVECSDGMIHARAPRTAMRKDLLLLARGLRPGTGPVRGRVRRRRGVLPQHHRGGGADEGVCGPSPQGPPRRPASGGLRDRDRARPLLPLDAARQRARRAAGRPVVDRPGIRHPARARSGRSDHARGAAGRPRDDDRGARRPRGSGPYGRYRAGCEITEISDGDRTAISELADKHTSEGEIENRNPDEVALRAEVRANRNNEVAERLGLASGQ